MFISTTYNIFMQSIDERNRVRRISLDKEEMQFRVSKINSELSQTLLNRGSIPRRLLKSVSNLVNPYLIFGTFFGAPAAVGASGSAALSPVGQTGVGIVLPAGVNVLDSAVNAALDKNFVKDEQKIINKLREYRREVGTVLATDFSLNENEKILIPLQREFLKDFQAKSEILIENILRLNDSTFTNKISIMRDINIIGTLISRNVPDNFRAPFLPEIEVNRTTRPNLLRPVEEEESYNRRREEVEAKRIASNRASSSAHIAKLDALELPLQNLNLQEGLNQHNGSFAARIGSVSESVSTRTMDRTYATIMDTEISDKSKTIGLNSNSGPDRF